MKKISVIENQRRITTKYSFLYKIGPPPEFSYQVLQVYEYNNQNSPKKSGKYGFT